MRNPTEETRLAAAGTSHGDESLSLVLHVKIRPSDA